MYPTFPSFRHQPPDASRSRFDTLPFSGTGFPLPAGLGFAPWQQARQHARPNRVRHPTDRWFTSSCFGPHLAATPLTFSYRPESACLERTCTSPIRYTLRRTATVLRTVSVATRRGRRMASPPNLEAPHSDAGSSSRMRVAPPSRNTHDHKQLQLSSVLRFLQQIQHSRHRLHPPFPP